MEKEIMVKETVYGFCSRRLTDSIERLRAETQSDDLSKVIEAMENAKQILETKFKLKEYK